MARPPKIPRETLEPLVRDRRAQGMTWKEIAKEIGGYHYVYLAAKCLAWNRGAIYCGADVAQTTVPELQGSKPAESGH